MLKAGLLQSRYTHPSESSRDNFAILIPQSTPSLRQCEAAEEKGAASDGWDANHRTAAYREAARPTRAHQWSSWRGSAIGWREPKGRTQESRCGFAD